ESKVAGDTTNFTTFLSPEGKVNISWLAKSAKTKDAKSILFAKLSNEIFIKESVYLINTQIDFSIMQAKRDSFQIKIPEDLSLVRVDGKDIKNWKVKDGILTIDLYEEIDKQYRLNLSAEKFRDINETTFDAPQFEVIDVKREDGTIIIKAEPSLRVKVEKKDKVTQLNPQELQGRTSMTNFVSAFEYFRRPFLVRLNISKIEPKITAEQNILISFSETMIDYYTSVQFNVKDAGVFKFKFLIPENFRVIDVGNEQTVDSFSVEKEGDQNILSVVLKNKAYGTFVLPLHLEADKEDKDISLFLPQFKSLDARKEEGIIALSLRKNLKLSTEDMKALRPISLEELQILGVRQKDNKNEIAAGYRYSSTDYSSQLKITKRETKIIASVERSVDIQETSMNINDVIRYNILYAPASRFKIQFPSSVGADAVITGSSIKEKKFIINERDKTGIWEIELHSPQLNEFTLNVNLEIKIPSVKTGESRSLEVPRMEVIDVFNESGVISIMKSPNLQVKSKESGVEPIDAKELPGAMNRSQSVFAFRYLSHPYALSIETTKHDYEKVLDTIVNQAHFDIIASNEGVIKTEGVFKIQNTNRQSLELKMSEGVDKIFSVFISG
ncbi:MAG: hypothetical protein KAR20_08255, partial [Candidatus Heimdallarchaeota archaeon]|nr:hypothetical protein [Candidatus Heimdallarchaeota archaeon]